MSSRASPLISQRVRLKPLIQVEQPEMEDPATIFEHHDVPRFETLAEYTEYFNVQMKMLEKLRAVQLAQSTEKQQHERYETLSFYPSKFLWGNLFAPRGCYTQILIGSAPIDLAPFYASILQFRPVKLLMLTNFVESRILAKRSFPLCKNEPEWLTRVALRYEKQERYEYEHGKMSFGIGKHDVPVQVSEQIWGSHTIHLDDTVIEAEFIDGKEDEFLKVNVIIRKGEEQMTLPLQATLVWKDCGTSDEAISFEDMHYICSEVAGERVACHCSAGIGRAGVFACCLALTEMGKKRSLSYQDAGNVVEELRLARSPGAVQKDYYFKYILEYAEFLNGIAHGK